MDAACVIPECTAALTSSLAVREYVSLLLAVTAPSVSGRDVLESGSVVGLTLFL